jgi:hypothetical protein
MLQELTLSCSFELALELLFQCHPYLVAVRIDILTFSAELNSLNGLVIPFVAFQSLPDISNNNLINTRKSFY